MTPLSLGRYAAGGVAPFAFNQSNLCNIAHIHNQGASPLQTSKETEMIRLFIIPALFVLAGASSPALASQIGAPSPSSFASVRSAPTLGPALGDQEALGLTKRSSGQQSAMGPSLSTGLSTALSVGGTDGASLSGTSITTGELLNPGSRGPVVQRGSTPTVQAAIGAAVSVGGNALAGAQNANSGKPGAARSDAD